MRIDESGQNDFARAIDLSNFLSILLQPRVAQRVFGRADRNDLPAKAQNRTVLDNVEFFEARAAAWSGLAGSESQRDQSANIGQKKRPDRLIWFSE